MGRFFVYISFVRFKRITCNARHGLAGYGVPTHEGGGAVRIR